MIQLKSAREIEAMARAGAVVADVLAMAAEKAVPGVTTAELDRQAEDLIRGREGAEPAFKGLYGFPATLCTSVNQEVVHGIPSEERVLASGDIVSVDCGVKLDGFYADAARTYAVGDVDAETERLVRVTRNALEAGVEYARAGRHVGDIGAAIQAVVEDAGFSVVRELVGHGVGRSAHEDPQIPNYGRRGEGTELQEGLVVAVEPMVNAGDRHIRTLDDEWTVVTRDGSRSAHFENTIAITADGPRVLTEAAVQSRRQTE